MFLAAVEPSAAFSLGLRIALIALIDENMPVVVLAPYDSVFDKTISSMQEVMARIEVPEVDPLITPLLYSVPIQLIAYHTAVVKGTDVDQSRNLAKSVTVK